jgi:NAD(P)-dependent dehydrogenase (short-subunit alcohol dehydrogenase family)
MTKTMIIAGYGPGISSAMAERFGKEGFALALVARNAERLAAGVKILAGKGIRAEAFPTDLADPSAARAMVEAVRSKLGPVTVLHWNAYQGAAGDLLMADVASLRSLFDVPVVSLVTAVQAALPDLASQKDAAVLITNGGLGFFDPAVDAMTVAWNAMGLGVANSAKHKASALLSVKLQPQGIYVGEVVVMGQVKGTAWDNGSATLEAATIANRFWEIYTARGPASVTCG